MEQLVTTAQCRFCGQVVQTPEEIVDLLREGVEQVYSGYLAKITLNMRGGLKACISQNAKGEINVERIETKKKKLTE